MDEEEKAPPKDPYDRGYMQQASYLDQLKEIDPREHQKYAVLLNDLATMGFTDAKLIVEIAQNKVGPDSV